MAAPPHAQEELRCISIALDLRPHIAELRLLILTLRVQHLENARITGAVTEAGQAQRGGGHFHRMLLGRRQLFGVMCQRVEYVGNLSERDSRTVCW